MANKNSLARNQSLSVEQRMSFSSFVALDDVKLKIEDVLGKDGVQNFVTSIVTAVSQNRDLQQCTYNSILQAALLGQALKLSPSPQLGQFYLVPFNSKGGKQAQFILGYKGYMQLAVRSGAYRKIHATEVKEGELISWDPFRQEAEFKPILDPEERARKETVGYYGYFELLNGYRQEIYWTQKEMEAHAEQYSKGYSSDRRKGTTYTFWSKDFEKMGIKTILRQLLGKGAILSPDLQIAYEADMAVIHEDGTKEFVDNPQAEFEAEFEEVPEEPEQKTKEPEPEPPPVSDTAVQEIFDGFEL